MNIAKHGAETHEYSETRRRALCWSVLECQMFRRHTSRAGRGR